MFISSKIDICTNNKQVLKPRTDLTNVTIREEIFLGCGRAFAANVRHDEGFQRE